MSDQQLNNTIYLMHTATRLFLIPNADLVRLYDVERQNGAGVLYKEVSNGL